MTHNLFLYFGLIYALIFLLLSLCFRYHYTDGIDTKVQSSVVHLKSWPMTFFMRFLSTVGGPVGVVGCGLILLVFRVFRNSFFLHLFIPTALSLITNLLLKESFDRARPSDKMVSAMGLSFPSGHAMVNSTLGTLCIFFFLSSFANPVLFILIVVSIVALICFSRIYLNVHYFSDVIAGICLGQAIGLLYIYFIL